MPTSIPPRARNTENNTESNGRSDKLALRGLGATVAILLLLAFAEIYVDWRHGFRGGYSEIEAYALEPLQGAPLRQRSADAAADTAR
ncbi:hypothetical protein SAMN05519103_06566 [Rhizobiales bacterium GAS113]|jgi:hypothetical protein|nr:hypothetical protein SAMN05519103_06566 [Rhizobiales bacterium GAS113]